MATVDEYSTSRGEVQCSYHPNVRTGLRCSRCGKPICPRCGVRTPVGLRCPDCAGVRGLPTYRTDSTVLLKAGAVGLAVAAVVGVLWAFIPDWGFYLALLMGFGVAEGMAWASKAKRGLDLQVIGIAAVVIGLIVSRVLLAQRLGISAAEVNALSGQVFTPEIFEEFGRPVSVAQALHIELSPDGIFAALIFLIVWIRFR